MPATEDACLNRMTSSPDTTEAAVVKAFADIPAFLEQTPAFTLRGRVERIDTKVCPLYLLTGEYDFSCTPEDTRRTAVAIGGASVTIMEQLGHFPMSENPEQFRRYIAPVLNDILKQSIAFKHGVHV
jgi:pimeloyl-ACP methyl ester carboxylesterase